MNTSGTLTQSLSDEREKKIIIPLDPLKSFNKIMNISTVKFNWLNLPDEADYIGVLAQNISSITNKAVCESKFQTFEDGTTNTRLRVNYNDLFIHNINATKYIYNNLTSTIKGQQEQIRSLSEAYLSLNNNVSSIVNHLIDITNSVNILNSR